MGSSPCSRDLKVAMTIAMLLADGLSFADFGPHTDDTPNMNSIVDQLESKVKEVKGASYLQEALRDVDSEWKKGERSRLEATQRKLELITERMKTLQETKSAVSVNTSLGDKVGNIVNQGVRGTKRAKTHGVPKVNPLRRRSGVDHEMVIITDVSTNEPAGEFRVDHFEPCPPLDDDGRRDTNEALLRSVCGHLSEAEQMVCLEHMDQEKHRGMVPCFRCTRPGKPCEPSVQYESWNRTCVDQGENSDHHQCSPSLGIGLLLSAQVLQVQFCNRPALFSLCKVCERVQADLPTVVGYADSTPDLENEKHDSKCVVYFTCNHTGVPLGKALSVVGAGHTSQLGFDDNVPTQYRCGTKNRPKRFQVENMIPLGKNPHPWTADDEPIPFNCYDIRRYWCLLPKLLAQLRWLLDEATNCRKHCRFS